MDDDLFNPLPQDSAASPPMAEAKARIDPKLLAKALMRMKGLVKGNGLAEEKVILLDTPENTDIKIYRFKARTSLTLVPQYGTRTEPGRNTTAEVVSSETEFRNTMAQIARDIRTQPQKRQQIVDFIFKRSDKGFGIQEQRTKFHSLSRDLVQHEKCNSCANTGKSTCAKCHGKTVVPCPKCIGKRYVLCPRCRGSTRIDTAKGTVQCTFCRGDGRVNCKTCGARGQIKCQNCAATGNTQCRICAASGWLSHLTHVEIYAQINFDFDRSNLPITLVQAIDRNPSKCVAKHDIEISVAKTKTLHDIPALPTHQEPDDTIWIDYEAISPFGPMTFKINDQERAGYLFGFQTRLLEFPFFMDALITSGVEALEQAARERKNIRPYLVKAVKYRLIADVIAQTLWIKNTVKAKRFLQDKYPTGLNPETIAHMVDLIDATLRNITRLWRTIGLVIGFIVFAIILEIYFLSDGREYFKSLGIPETLLTIADSAMFPLGVALGILGSKFAAKWSQDKVLHKIVPKEVLRKTLPKAGKTVRWTMIISAGMIAVFLALTMLKSGPVPLWLNFLVESTLSTIHAG